jgi:DNA-binding NarL/FixJ family response regulator
MTPVEAVTHVAVVDDQECVRLSLRNLLQPTGHFRFVGSFSNAIDALDGIPVLLPDLALMDVGLPDLNGIECAKRLLQSMPSLKVVMMTGSYDADHMEAALRAGATAYLLKSASIDQFLASLRFAAVQPPPGARPKPAHRPLRTVTSDSRLPLSTREKEVLMNLSEGLLYKEISFKMGVSFSTVHKHQNNIFKKLRVNNRSEATRIWLANGGG